MQENSKNEVDFASNIIYEDNYLFVINKPSGISTLGNKASCDLVYQTKKYIKQTKDKKGNVYLGLVHRLDKETSGVLLFAKNTKSAKRISGYIRKKMFFKIYLAILDKKAKNYDRMEDLLWKNPEENKCYVLQVEDRNKVKFSITDYHRIYKTLYMVLPFTGRYHQIRCQFSYRGCPVRGDKKYGSRYNPPMLLHSFFISTLHPKEKNILFFVSFPFNYFLDVLDINYQDFIKHILDLLANLREKYSFYLPDKVLNNIFKGVISGDRFFFVR